MLNPSSLKLKFNYLSKRFILTKGKKEKYTYIYSKETQIAHYIKDIKGAGNGWPK